MKKDELPMEDDLRPEYDLKNLRVRRMGSKRKNFVNRTVRLEADVAAMFPDANSVNEALRFLMRITKEKQELMSKSNPQADK